MARGTGQPTIDVRRRCLAVAQDRQLGDLLLRSGLAVSVFRGEAEAADVVIADGWITVVGPFQRRARETVSLLVWIVTVDRRGHLDELLQRVVATGVPLDEDPALITGINDKTGDNDHAHSNRGNAVGR